MARQRAASPPQIRSVFASRTAFDALSVDSGEESEEEQVQVEETPENNLEEVQDTQEPWVCMFELTGTQLNPDG